MVYGHTNTYYSSLQDTLTSICNSLLIPFSSKKNRRLPMVDRKLAKSHTDTLKWQQESFHRMLHLIGLRKEGIVSESEVSAFRTRLLGTLVASPAVLEPANVVRDKLLFLQELFYAKCISEEEYHSSKRPLIRRLAAHGAEIDCRDIIVGGGQEEWSVIELHDDDEGAVLEGKAKQQSPLKSIWNKMAGKGNPNRTNQPYSRDEHKKSVSILIPEAEISQPVPQKSKRKAFHSLFHMGEDESKSHSAHSSCDQQGRSGKSSRKQEWGFDGFKKWIRSSEDKAIAPCSSYPLEEDSSSFSCSLVASPIGEGPNLKQIKKTMHSNGSPSDFFIDKVLGDNIKKELSRIRSELRETNPKLELSNEQIQAISTKLPVEKNDLKKFFPKSWCESYGDIVLDVVKKEFRDHVNEMERMRSRAMEKKGEKWMTFEDNDENSHPNLFPHKKMNFANPKLQQHAQHSFWDHKYSS